MNEASCQQLEKSVLIIDDEALIRMNLAASLEDEGVFQNIYEADSGAGAIAELKLRREQGSPINLAIVDLRLPDMQGEALILNLLEHQPELKIIIHTGSTEFTPSKVLVDKGIQHRNIIHKPLVNIEILKKRIRELDNQHPMELDA